MNEKLVAGDYVVIVSGQLEGLVGIIRFTLYPGLASVYFPITTDVERLSGSELNTIVDLSLLAKSTAEEYEYCVKAKELRRLHEENSKINQFLRRVIFNSQPNWRQHVYRDSDVDNHNDNRTSMDTIIIDPSLFF